MAAPVANDRFDGRTPPPEAWAYAKHTRRPVMVRQSRPVPPMIADHAQPDRMGFWGLVVLFASVVVMWTAFFCWVFG